ncbi:tetratricopeptide repeat protein [Massilia glaciei]|uniref:Tetratricopeptide repeat protein n=1 Tax=Massilia glaciei TaxID=1524097 RepID=A0A2U2HLQ6_9BURK|nr:tetratricopeptide repeat protein [Massilia glaciei]
MTAPPSAIVAALLQQAIGCHQHGKFDAARELYGQVLALAPRQFDALHLSGVAARQLGQVDTALALIGRAIGIDPAQANAHCNLGAALQDAGRPDEALASYDRAIALNPGYALALCNRGNTLRNLGRLEEAIGSYQRALALRPAYPEAHCNLALALHDAGRAGEALASAGRALGGRPDYPEALCARARALHGLHRFGEALRDYDRAIALKPDWAEARCWRGAALQRLQRFDEALAAYESALALKPDYPLAHQYRANTLRALGRPAEAVAAYRSALAQGGDATQIGYALAALGVGQAPAAAPAAYVAGLFDQYADHFDHHLVGVLGYQMPALLDAAIRRAFSPRDADTLDLGCGTGLCGPYLRAYSKHLVGVDLSEKMLDKARLAGCYDALFRSELAQYLSGRTDVCDLVVAADVFVYIGDLAPVFGAVHGALRPGGGFCFSVEACDSGEFTLRPSNRFAHSLAYVRALAAAAGFEVVEAERRAGREEDGVGVMAYAVTLRSLKPKAAL